MHLKRILGAAVLAVALGIALPALGTVPTTTGSVTFIGNGSTTVFAVPFRFLANADLVVTVTDTSGNVATKVLSTDYTVSGAGSSTGTVTFTTAPPSNYVVRIRRVMALTQPTSLRSQTTFSPTTHEAALDRLAMQVQQLNDQVATPVNPSPLTNLSPVTATGTATARTLADRFADFASVRDFGAKGDGTTDDTAAIQAAVSAVATGGRLFVPAGTYRLTSQINVAGSLLMDGPSQGAAIFDIQHSATGFAFAGGFSERQAQLRNLTIQSTRASYTPTGVSFSTGLVWPLVENVHFKNIKGSAIAVSDGRRLLVKNSWFDSCGSTTAALACIHITGGTTGNTATWIEHNIFEPWDYAAIYSPGGFSGAKITNNWFESTLNAVSGGTATYAIFLTGTGWTTPATDYNRDINIQGNKFVLYDATAQQAIRLNWTDTAKVTENWFTTGLYGIYLDSVRRGFFSGNAFELCGVGIYANAASESRILGNDFSASVTNDIASGASSSKLLIVDNITRGTVSLANATMVSSEFRRYPLNAAFVWNDRGDSDVTLTVGADSREQRFATALTANRTVTLSTTGAVHGDRFRIVRTGLGAFTLNVGGLKTIPAATAAVVEVEYHQLVGGWVLVGYQTL